MNAGARAALYFAGGSPIKGGPSAGHMRRFLVLSSVACLFATGCGGGGGLSAHDVEAKIKSRVPGSDPHCSGLSNGGFRCSFTSYPGSGVAQAGPIQAIVTKDKRVTVLAGGRIIDFFVLH